MKGKYLLPLIFLLALCACEKKAMEPPPSTETPLSAETVSIMPEITPTPEETPLPTKNPYTDPTYYPMPEVSWTGEEWERIQALAGDEAGEVYHYYRMEVDQAICELIQYYQWLGEEDSWNLWEGGWRTELWYTPKDGEPQKYLVENVINSGLVEEEKLVFADVDYDGTEEILVGRGHFGNRGYLFYACYFQREGTLQFCESFSEIRNPCLDREKKAILSCWTQSGAGYVWSFYEYQEQSFVETRRLTVIFRPLDDGFELCTVEILQNDQMETIHQWQGNECSYERLEELFFNEGNDWALHTDRWEYI